MKKQKFISQCCVCKKVRRKEGFRFTDRTHMDEWDHHEEDLKKLHEEFDVVYSHGYCEPCADKTIKKFDEETKQKQKKP